MKILFLGEIGSGQTSLMRMRAFARLGHDVRGVNTVEPWKAVSKVERVVSRRLQHGRVVDRINAAVVDAARDFRPDLIWGEKQEYLRTETLEVCKSMGARLAHFTPDPYFSLSWKRTRLMDEAMLHFDALIYCKSYEAEDYARTGKPLVFMPLGYCDEVHRPLPSADPKWSAELGFLGGWEPRREQLAHALLEAGLPLKIWGGYWEFLSDGQWTLRRAVILRQLAGRDAFAFHRDPWISSAHQGGEVYGDDYARALTGAKIGIGFLRNVVPDQHTTRTFEIPACGSMLLADRTEEHRSLYEEGKEAEFFSSPEELVDKAAFYIAKETARADMAAAGRQRAIDSRYAYIHRLDQALNNLKTLGIA